MKSFEVRTMSRAEVDLAMEWAAAEGWNPGLHDAACFHEADRSGFLVGVLDGEPVSTISVVRYGADFGFLGCYIVKPEFRGRGHGLATWQAGMRYLAGRKVGLDGVVAQQDNYRKSGFTLAYRNVRHEGMGGGHGQADPRVVRLSQVPFESIQAYDRQLFPADRSSFLRCWIAQPSGVALGFVGAAGLQGYGVLRPCRLGYKIGPLFADTPDIAAQLFAALRSHVALGEKVFLDTPEVNPAAMELARSHGMNAVFETARMYTGDAPAVPLERVYGVTSFELG